MVCEPEPLPAFGYIEVRCGSSSGSIPAFVAAVIISILLLLVIHLSSSSFFSSYMESG